MDEPRTSDRWRGIYLGIVDQLGHRPSLFEQTLLRQAATLAVQTDELVAAKAAGERIDSRELRALIAEHRRVLQDLGVKPAERKEPAAASLRAYVGGGRAA